ncbi:FG-GAP-like repeat-containing protein [Phycicoccus sp. M110.8]|uniref:FG-GAP-like repeat-containing protein n=1 Tax=Phycicoccus sp. M110.8 TaxID=3075433 RepID=UPI0028FD6159|nr:FG-GAP-like repeat-containing protein [Phycicoccus sp. M110.8]MDU0312601.1 FG-GAP-like repeat-containing protein [Phycicoccus sp. M110.8]
MSGRTKAIITSVVTAAAVVLCLGSAPAQAVAHPADATAASDWSGDGRADIVAPTTDGRLWLYAGGGNGGFTGARTAIGTGWSSRDQIRMVGDFDGVAGTDIIARQPSTGALWLYSGNGAGGFRSYQVIGSGWQIFSQIFSPGDWDGDGHADLLAIVKSDGSLRMYRGNGSGRFLGMRVIGSGWSRYDGLMTTGDFDGDGLPDFLARNTATGELRLYRGDGAGGFAATKVVGTGWKGFTALLGLGDWSGDGHSDVLARLADGSLRMYRGDGRGAWIAPYPIIGTGWNAIRLPGETTGSAPPSAGTVCSNPYFTTSSSNGGVTDHGYYVHNNLWNAAKYPGTKGTTQVCSYHSWNHIGTASNTNGNGEVKTYPNVHKDYSGRTISSFSRLTSSFAATSPGRGIYNVAYDLWLNGVPNDEVMIWTDNYRQVPAGSRFASGVSLGGHTWDVYATSGNGYIAFVPSNGARLTSGTVDIKAMLGYLVARGRVASSATVDQICYGVEIVDTGGSSATWKFTNFSITDS